MLPEGDEKEIPNGEGPDDEVEQDADEGHKTGAEDEGTDSPDGDEAEGDDEEQVDGAPRKRGEGRFQRLANSNKELKEQLAATQREIQEFRAQQQRAQSQEKEPTADEMALWAPEQRMQYTLDKATRATQSQLQQMQFQMADTADKANFQTIVANNPIAKKYAGEVEAKLAEARKTGGNPPREVVLAFLLGQKALQAGGKVKEAKAEGQKRIERQTTKSANNRSDTNGAGRSRDTALRKRLEGVQI